MKFKDWLIKQRACSEAIDWVGERTLEQAWPECEHGDWLLWLAQKVGVDLKILTLAKVRCARLVEHLMTEKLSLEALDVAEKFALGRATRDELDAAAISARAASYASYAYDARAASYASYAAAAAVSATDASWAAYSAAVAAASRDETLKKCADIVRQTISLELIKERIGNEI